MATPSDKPTIVFCSGAWHTAFHIKPIIPHFERAGFQVIPCPLPSAGNKVGPDVVCRTIKDAILSGLERNSSVAVILHSAAGMFGVKAVNEIIEMSSDPNLTERIKILFLASMLSWGPITLRLIEKEFIEILAEEDATRATNTDKSFFNDMSPEGAKPFIDALRFQANASEPDLGGEAWRQCDLTHICCMKDNASPPEWQIKLAEDYGMRVTKIEAGHDAFISVPQKLVEVIAEVLQQK